MIESKDIRKMVEHVIRRQQGVADREPMDPAREWLTGITITALFVCVGGLVSYQYYSTTIAFEVVMTDMSTPSVPYSAVRVEEALTWYEARAERYGQLRGTLPTEPVTSIIVPVVEAEVAPETDTATSTPADTGVSELELSTPVEDSGSETEVAAPELSI